MQLRYLLGMFSSFHASLGVDKIYAMLGMANDVRNEKGELLIRPDYNKSLLEVNLELTAFMMQRDGNLHALDYVTVHQDDQAKNTQSLAGWVHDWTSKSQSGRRLGHNIEDGVDCRPYQPDRGSPTLEMFSIAESLLSAPAFLVNEVSIILEPIGRIQTDHDDYVIEAIIKNWNFIDNHDLKYYEGADRLQAFWRVMGADVANVQRHWPRHFSASKIVSSSHVSLTSLQNTCPRDQEHMQFYYVLKDMNIGRRLFLASDGRMGLGPNNMQHGDQIVILQGARTPFVLRRLGHSDEHTSLPLYGVVGEAYVDGLMQGELFGEGHGGASGWQRVVLSNQ